ncbi:hypothetical protein KFE25_012108 [Diacronema lutheri]|uniref:SAM-dependent MTase RsmB/NOP-type domain-containing protein n=1 Tax=Diacronema lutheri TaxID=2081491 RepID=A0A8J5X9D1_DIALT|nr:hypothetical protein KFE25_012108 [Diacronema lutheri]
MAATRARAPEWHASTPDAARFPPAFLAFLAKNDISVDNYSISEVLRFVRVNPRSHAADVSLAALRAQLGPSVEPVPWLRGFFSMESGVKIASSTLYAHSHIYGIDAASGAAVAALGAQEGENVLDLCCAPGAKLCMLAEAVGPTGTVTGVDLAPHRLAACRTLCAKYALENVRLFLGDGSKFAAAPPNRAHRAAGNPCVAGSPCGTDSPHAAGVHAAEGSGGDGDGGGEEEGAGADRATPGSVGDGDGGGAALRHAAATAAGAHARDGAPPAACRMDPSQSGARVVAPTGGAHAKRRRDARAAVVAAQVRSDAAPTLLHAGALVRAPDAPPTGSQPIAEARSSSTAALCVGGGDRHVDGGYGGYDRVLVDAECTHDGSVKHLAKFAAWGWETFEARVLDAARLTNLEALQRSLLSNGFEQLRPGGELVYSTCSFARRQNEDIVRWLLEREPRAACVPIGPLAGAAPCRPGGVEHTVRFEPCSSRTSALFIAKVCRRRDDS